METIIQKFLDYGLTGGVLVVLCYLLLYQMKSAQKWADTIAANTEATRAQTALLKELMGEIRESKEVSEKVLDVMDNCHNHIKKKRA